MCRWGQICILGSLATYRPRDVREASDIIERVIPRLQHVNSSVVLSAVKTLMIYLGYNFSEELDKTIIRKLAPPLGMYPILMLFNYCIVLPTYSLPLTLYHSDSSLLAA